MAILTESKIRKLLKTTDLKKTKRLVLEPGTIITPSARGYLNDITIHFGEEMPEPESEMKPELPIQVMPKTGPKENRITKNWRIEVDTVLNIVLQKQFQSHQQQKLDQVAEIAVILNILKDLREMNVDEDYAIAASFVSTVTEVQEKYPQISFIPDYAVGEWALHFYDCFVRLRALESQASIQLKDYLLDEEYHQLKNHCRLLIDYAWLLMVQQLETKS